MGAGGAVAKRAGAACIARHDSPDRARVAGAEVEPCVLAGGACGLLKRRQGRAGAGRDLPHRRVDMADVCQALQGEDHLLVARNAGADQAGVSSLGHDRCPVARARGHGGGNLGSVGRADHEPGRASVAAGVVPLVWRRQVRVAQNVLGAHDLD
jgi:hypothetical protein